MYKMDVRVLRPVNVFGPGQKNGTTLITRTTSAILKGQVPILLGADVKREWLYIDDMVDAYLLVGAAEGLGYEVLNVGSGARLCNSQVINMVSTLLGKGSGHWDRVPTNIEDYDQGVDSSLFRAYFPEWSPLDFLGGLRKTVEYYRKECGK